MHERRTHSTIDHRILRTCSGSSGQSDAQTSTVECLGAVAVATAALTKCDASVPSDLVKVGCEGRCDGAIQVSGGAVACAGDFKAYCTVASPNEACTGDCRGNCELMATVSTNCTGKCVGTCDGACSPTTASTSCNGTCIGNCRGTCKLAAGGKCVGTCRGDCSVALTSSRCDTNAVADCFVSPQSGVSSVACPEQCEGAIALSAASVECSVSAKCAAELQAECPLPSVGVVWTDNPAASPDASAAYTVFLDVFKVELSKLNANLRRADLVLNAADAILGNLTAVSKTFAEAQIGTVDDRNRALSLGCAMKQLPSVAGELVPSTTSLTASIEAGKAFLAAFE